MTVVNVQHDYQLSSAYFAYNRNLPVPRGDGVMDSALACCAGGLGSIPAIGEAKQEAIQMVFLSA